MIFEEKLFFCSILFTDQNSLSGCLYFVRYWTIICLLQLFIDQVVMFVNFENNLIFRIKPFFLHGQKVKQKFKYLENKKSFKMKYKAFFTFLKGFHWRKWNNFFWKVRVWLSLLYKILFASCKSGPHFMPVLKMVERSPGSRDKVIYMIFLSCLQVKPVWKLQYMVEPDISILVLFLCFICNSYLGCMAAMMMF